jgi:hypothetical protein
VLKRSMHFLNHIFEGQHSTFLKLEKQSSLLLSINSLSYSQIK